MGARCYFGEMTSGWLALTTAGARAATAVALGLALTACGTTTGSGASPADGGSLPGLDASDRPGASTTTPEGGAPPSDAGGARQDAGEALQDAGGARQDAGRATGDAAPAGGPGAADAAARPDGPVASPLDARSDVGGSMIGMRAPVFDGRTGYVEIPDQDAYSASTTGAITIEAWMRPDSVSMPAREGTGYVHWLGKGGPGQHEWVARMYQRGNSENRANRISFYAFNLTGGLGAGSYFQDEITVGTWIHYFGVIDARETHVYRDGVLRDSDPLAGYDITPRNGSAPVRIGTRDLGSFFQGSVARVAIYSARLSNERVRAHYAARGADYDAVVMAEPSLVGYWRLDESTGATAIDARGGRHGRYVGGVQVGGTTWAPR